LQSKFAKQRFISFLKAGIPFGIPAFSVIYCGVAPFFFVKMVGNFQRTNSTPTFWDGTSFFFRKMVGDFQKQTFTPIFLNLDGIPFFKN